MTDIELLTQHQNGSESAFADLVRRHLAWVYGLARRRLGDAHLAEDVAQAVFVLLHRKSPRFAGERAMMSWLYKTACYASDSAARSERRRQHRESKVAMERPEAMQPDESPEWHELAPMLDELIGRLSRSDREAILLRYYRDLTLAEVAEQIGTTPDAARKRIERGVERLRRLAVERGESLSATSLVAGLSTLIRIPPPAGLIATTTVAATAHAASALSTSTAGIVKGALAMMSSAKITAVSIATVALIAVGGAVCATIWTISSSSSVAANANIAANSTVAPMAAAPMSPAQSASNPQAAPGPPAFPGAGAQIVRAGRQNLPKLAPYSAIRWHNLTPEVQVNGQWYQLVAIDDVTVVSILNARGVGRDSEALKQKHFSEDIFELLAGMGHTPGNVATLQLRGLDANHEEVTLPNVPMTAENRRALMNWPAPGQTSLFRASRMNDSLPQIQENDTWYQLLAIDNISVGEMKTAAVAAWGKDWLNHNAIEMMSQAGHRPTGESLLRLRTLDTGEVVTVSVRVP